MIHEPLTDSEPAQQLGQRLADSLAQRTFVRLVLSSPEPANDGVIRVTGRCIELKQVPHLSLTSHFATRDVVENIAIAQSVPWVLSRLGSPFSNALLCTTRGDWQFTTRGSARPRLIRHKPSVKTAPSREHDQRHQTLLDASAQDWLCGLGVTNARGFPKPGMADKHTQIRRYLEIFSHLAKDLGWVEGLGSEPNAVKTVVDMGCGKGYLTFGLWHLCRRIWKLPVRVLGVDVREDLTRTSHALAQSIGAVDLQFIQGDISSVPVSAASALIALHACDTATDDAITRGIQLGAELILVAPCCHKELRPEFGNPPPFTPVLKHGIMAERLAEWTTDGLRALFLEWAGYRTKLIEFVASEHTPKNLMIAAVRQRPPFGDLAIRAQILELKAFFGLRHHRLDSLLEAGPSALATS